MYIDPYVLLGGARWRDVYFLLVSDFFMYVWPNRERGMNRMLGLFNPFFSIISKQILHTSPIVSAVMRRRICFTVKTLHVNPFPFFLMTFNHVVIEIFSFVHSWKKWEGFRISFFFVGEDGWNFLEMGEPKLTAYLWYCRKKKMTTSCTRARTENACD